RDNNMSDPSNMQEMIWRDEEMESLRQQVADLQAQLRGCVPAQSLFDARQQVADLTIAYNNAERERSDLLSRLRVADAARTQLATLQREIVEIAERPIHDRGIARLVRELAASLHGEEPRGTDDA